MATISRSGIAASSTISATHITNIIDALDGIGVTTIVATGSFSGSLTGVASTATLATKASTLSQGGGNGAAMTFNTTLPGGQPTYVWGTNNGTDVYIYNPSVFSVASATSASYVANAATATNATNASNVPYSGISSKPAGISVDGGVSVVDANIVADGTGTFITSASLLASGRFYSVSAKTDPIIILLDNSGGTTGIEFTFFGKDVNYPITFVSSSNADKIISENGYLSMYGTGSAVTAKLISDAPVIWALIGSLKA